MNGRRIERFYMAEIEEGFLPYWKRFVDHEYGGILNCISNDGEKRLSDNKFTWSEGRWLWVLSHIHALAVKGVLTKVNTRELETWMKGTYDWMKTYSIYDDYRCCYLLTRTGEKLPDARTGRYDASIYADCFALIGMSNYIREMDIREEIHTADKLASSILDRIESGDFLTEPYPVPAGYGIHGVPMILVNTFQEYGNMKDCFGEEHARFTEYANRMVSFILDDLYDPESGIIREHKSTDEMRSVNLIDRHVNPGHIIEDVWFWVENLTYQGKLDERLDQIAHIAESAFNLGWDREYGGLFRFVDYKGGQPHGELIDTPYENLVSDSWDMKLWWPHSELLYSSLLLNTLTGDEKFERIYEKAFEYAYSTFPSRTNGEWIQIRRRDGSPEEKVVALPVKDPFHIMRNMIKIVELIESEGGER